MVIIVLTTVLINLLSFLQKLKRLLLTEMGRLFLASIDRNHLDDLLGGIYAPQNLHRTVLFFLSDETTCDCLHFGQSRLRPKILPSIAEIKIGFILSSPAMLQKLLLPPAVLARLWAIFYLP